jgi:cell wall-associated NlpC family hydrolase
MHLWIAAIVFAVFAALCMPAMADEPVTTDYETPRTRLQNFADRAAELVMHAMGLIGIRYKYGGGTPESGLDCSGLVGLVFKEAWGLNLPRKSEEISRVGQRIDAVDLQPGDLVFYNTLRRSFSHVGIYLGDQRFIHAPAAGGKVRIESMDVTYWKKRYNGARRLKDPTPLAAANVITPVDVSLSLMTPTVGAPALTAPNLATAPAGP